MLWFRQVSLLNVLQQRGHASLHRIEYHQKNENTQDPNYLPKSWFSALKRIRRYPQWSSLVKNNAKKYTRKREETLQKLISSLE